MALEIVWDLDLGRPLGRRRWMGRAENAAHPHLALEEDSGHAAEAEGEKDQSYRARARRAIHRAKV